MLQAFYTATVGAQQQMERMGVQGNNMATRTPLDSGRRSPPLRL